VPGRRECAREEGGSVPGSQGGGEPGRVHVRREGACAQGGCVPEKVHTQGECRERGHGGVHRERAS
jgi:hypothetical protein